MKNIRRTELTIEGKKTSNLETFKDENFKIVDIEINAWSPLFANLKIVLILSLYPVKFLKFNQS